MKCSRKIAIFILAGIMTLGAQNPLFAQKTGHDLDDGRANPEASSGIAAKKLVRAKKHMIVAANPHAARAGLEILRRGGSAIDAAIATQLVLNLVEPQSSGIGGGAFLLHWDKAKSDLKTYDGREGAPAAARPDRFLTADGKRMRFFDAVASPLSVGVPGLLRALEMAHQNHGKLPWKDLFTPAIKLAERGFAISPRLHKLLSGRWTRKFSPIAKKYFFAPNGKPWPLGHILKNPELADTLRLLAAQGTDVFYNGAIARDILRTLKSASPRADMTMDDLATYKARRRPPVCINYRKFKICGMGPPSSGALTIGQTLKLIEGFDLGHTPMNARALHIIAEAEKLAYADRNRYIADPDFVAVPKGLHNPAYLKKRASLINPEKSMGKAKPGTPPNVREGRYGSDATLESSGTSHISIIDSRGNAVAMTTTIESGFGSGHMLRGFLLNNELTDFSFHPEDKTGRPVANRIEPLKRPRSSMAPTMIFDRSGKLRMITGSPGGSRIILYVLKSIIAHIDWQANAAQAAAWPNFGSRNGPFEIEKDQVASRLRQNLEARGHKIRITPMTSGTHVIILRNGIIEGGVDPRREGRALGD